MRGHMSDTVGMSTVLCNINFKATVINKFSCVWYLDGVSFLSSVTFHTTFVRVDALLL